jgi:3-dehydroquinate synthetase
MVSPSITRPLLVELIYLCASFKASVVVSDESEKSARKILNFGHTFGHALEAVSDMKIPHGLAVAYGLLCALNLSARLGVLKAKARSDFIKLPLRFADATVLKFSDPKKLVRAMAHDKKNFNGKLQFVLLAGIGEVALNVNCPNSLVEDAIELANEQYRNAMR